MVFNMILKAGETGRFKQLQKPLMFLKHSLPENDQNFGRGNERSFFHDNPK